MTEPEFLENQRRWIRNLVLALVATMVTGAVTVVWGSSNMWTRVGELERQMQITLPMAERIAHVETGVEDLKQGIKELNRLLRLPPEQRR